MSKIRPIALVLLCLLFSCKANAVTLVWDASENTDGYKIYWGSQSGVYDSSADVGDVLRAELDIPFNSYVAATAYNSSGESVYSNEIFYEQGAVFILPPTGPLTITTVLDQVNIRKLGKDYEMVWSEGKWIVINRQLNAGDTVRYGW